jgi:hypothetical protein
MMNYQKPTSEFPSAKGVYWYWISFSDFCPVVSFSSLLS